MIGLPCPLPLEAVDADIGDDEEVPSPAAFFPLPLGGTGGAALLLALAKRACKPSNSSLFAPPPPLQKWPQSCHPCAVLTQSRGMMFSVTIRPSSPQGGRPRRPDHG